MGARSFCSQTRYFPRSLNALFKFSHALSPIRAFRKFWRENLPRLKYHNPAVPIIINRHHENDTPPTMTIYMRSADRPAAAESPDSTTPLFSSHSDLAKAPQPAPGERAVRIDMKDKHSSEILHSFMTETSATPLQPTAEDISEMQALDALRQRGDIDRERVRQERAEKKREEDMLKRARAAGGMEDMEAS